MGKTILSAIIGCFVIFGFLFAVTGRLQWALIGSFLVFVGGIKYIRIQLKEAANEIEYDERVYDNHRKFSFQSLATSQLLLLISLLASI
ncbi:hypothetical protein [Fictibacillus barbaricus]|uniref:DUF3899 domain-containing protein n=1 Tax=Fictibacillus barbaricus TaxID=182136 RepID=A0ABU1U071_9BACL|nr:hypothetical protein [Fictibacillus barbaricus]MDR7072855.1 hypothetical protein [Fictibacillus barbaricus]